MEVIIRFSVVCLQGTQESWRWRVAGSAGEANASWGSWLGWAGRLPGASPDLDGTAVGTMNIWELVFADYHRSGPSAACAVFFFDFFHYIYLFTCGGYMPC